MLKYPMLLTKDEIAIALLQNTYSYEGVENKSRPSCGFYDNQTVVPALCIPGGDYGEIAVLLAASVTYGFEVDVKCAFMCLAELVGGVQNITFHDNLSHPSEAYRYLNFVKNDFKAFGLDEQSFALWEDLIHKNKIQIPSSTIKTRKEDVFLILNCPINLYPQCELSTEYGSDIINIFAYHAEYAGKRRKILCRALIESGSVKLNDDFDEEYLYEVLSETTDNHLFETVSRIGRNMPIFYIDKAENNGSFVVLPG